MDVAFLFVVYLVKLFVFTNDAKWRFMKRVPFILILACRKHSIGEVLFFKKYTSVYMAVQSAILLIVTSLISCTTVQVYKEPDQPIFESAAKNRQPVKEAGSLSVVTFNIKKAKKTELAAVELQQFRKTTNVGVYLLQEMDQKGVEVIAKTLDLNYLYIPIQYNKTSKKDVGNAILTEGTIDCREKLILPHSKWLSKGRRLVTIAEVSIDDRKILVYSVHTETLVMSKKKRMDQVDLIIEHAKMQLPNYKYILIGGDFNTLLSKDSEWAVEKFNDSGFDWSTAVAGNTARAFFGLIRPRHDYIFSKGLQVMNAYKIEASRSSDHYPVLATFKY
jgi:endonuclease/exonuclease/phosphatase family metal-dependent hydrolase